MIDFIAALAVDDARDLYTLTIARTHRPAGEWEWLEQVDELPTSLGSDADMATAERAAVALLEREGYQVVEGPFEDPNQTWWVVRR